MSSNFSNLGKIIIFIGLGITIFGAIIFFVSKISFAGRLPGDINIKKENFSFHFPISTSVLLSIILTIVINIILFIIFKIRK